MTSHDLILLNRAYARLSERWSHLATHMGDSDWLTKYKPEWDWLLRSIEEIGQVADTAEANK